MRAATGQCRARIDVLMSVENANASTDATHFPSDLPQRLNEAEMKMRLYEALERVFTNAGDLQTGCRQTLRVVCESLGMQSGGLLFSDPTLAPISWPNPTISDKSWHLFMAQVKTANATLWTRLPGNPPCVMLGLPVREHEQISACLILTSDQLLDPSDETLTALDTLGLRLGSFIAHQLAITRDLPNQQRYVREQEYARRNLNIQYNVTRVLAEAGTPDEGIYRVLSTICQGLNWQYGAWWRVDEAAQRLRYTTSWHAPGVNSTAFDQDNFTIILTRGKDVLGMVWQTGQPIWTADVPGDPRFGRNALIGAMGMNTVILIPVFNAGKVVAIMEFLCHNRQPADASLLQMLRALGAQIGGFLDRKRVQEALRESEERFRQLAEYIDYVLWIRDPRQNKVLYVSPAFERLFGISREAVLSNPIAVIKTIHRDDRKRVLQALRQQDSALYDIEYRLHQPDGTLRWVTARNFLIYDEQGDVLRAIGVVQDITERKTWELLQKQLLKRTQELYDISRRIGMADTADDVLSSLLKVSYLHRAHRATVIVFETPWVHLEQPPPTGMVYASYSPQGIESPALRPGQHFSIAPEEAQQMQPLLIGDVKHDARITPERRRMLASQGTNSIACFPLIANGDLYGTLLFHFKTLHALSNEEMDYAQGLVGQAAVAIHNMRLLEAEGSARQQAERANELRLRFLGMISHELRTPLTSIKGFATTLLASDLSWDAQNQHEFLSIIDSEADKLADMIDQLLDLSRIESGSLRIEPKQQPFKQVLDAAHPNLILAARDHPLVIDVPADLPEVNTDYVRISQVLVNLVSNAAKYSPTSTLIQLNARCENGMLIVQINDQGQGIAPDDRPYVFEAFRRGSGRDIQHTKGAGLGLAICKGIIEAHGGRIWIDERPEPGTSISFSLPCGA
jgi:PAS domain S-box-containing protein